MAMWVLSYWLAILHFIQAKSECAQAMKWLERKGDSRDFQHAAALLQEIPWTTHLEERSKERRKDLLTAYFNYDWVNDIHVDQMLAILCHHLHVHDVTNILVAKSSWSWKFLLLYHHSQDNYMEQKNIMYLKSTGEVITNGACTQFAMAVFVKVLGNGTTALPKCEGEGSH